MSLIDQKLIIHRSMKTVYWAVSRNHPTLAPCFHVSGKPTIPQFLLPTLSTSFYLSNPKTPGPPPAIWYSRMLCTSVAAVYSHSSFSDVAFQNRSWLGFCELLTAWPTKFFIARTSSSVVNEIDGWWRYGSITASAWGLCRSAMYAPYRADFLSHSLLFAYLPFTSSCSFLKTW